MSSVSSSLSFSWAHELMEAVTQSILQAAQPSDMFRQTPRNEKRTRFARLLYFGQRLVVTINHYVYTFFTLAWCKRLHTIQNLRTVFECIPPTSTKRNASTLMAIRHRCSSDLVQYNSNQRFSGSPSSGSLTFQGFPKLRSSRNLEITHFGTSRVTSFAAPKKDPSQWAKAFQLACSMSWEAIQD